MSASLKIGFDAKRVFQNFTGLGNFSRTLLQDLAEKAPELALHLFAPKKVVQERTAPFLLPPYRSHFSDTIFRTAWRTKGIVKDLQKEKIDIYHGLSHEIPLGIEKTGIKSVVSIHDLIIKADPKQFKYWDRKIYDKKFKSSCERADQIVAISQSTRNDIIKYYAIPPEKIAVIYQTCHAQFKAPVSSEDTTKFLTKNQFPSSYLLYVGSAIERKNLLGLVKAINVLPESLKIPLVVVAGASSYRKKVQSYVEKKGMQKQVIFTDSMPFHELPFLYAGATALCYPSIYEGFGLPVIESLFCGTPVITGDNSSLPEAAGPGAILIDALDKASLVDALSRMLEDITLRKSLTTKGFKHVQQFHAAPIIEQWKSLYRQLA